MAVCARDIYLLTPLLIQGLLQSTVSPLYGAQPGIVWKMYELPLAGPSSTANPFDSDAIRADVSFSTPSGRTLKLPAFWWQNYSAQLNGNNQVLTLSGRPGWRVRFCPTEVGLHQFSSQFFTNGIPAGSPTTDSFNVTANPAPVGSGFVRVADSRQFFATTEGNALPLVGANLCWPGSRGTADYVDWLTSLKNQGGNFARLWMSPWALGIECEKGTLTRYRLDRAWQLDQVFQLAEARGIRLLLCLDYHGMFSTKPDFWGANDNWKINPYNTANSGPCTSPNQFFLNATAAKLYQKRLRYLIARYSYSPSLMAWEFLNEIDNVYGTVVPADVASWHSTMATWLKSQDPFHHLVTTSTSGDDSVLWKVNALDFTQIHSYGATDPASGLATAAQQLQARYQRPVLIGEYGIDFSGWARAKDPSLRGLSQALWGGAVGGSAGTAMSWWWENLQSENVYPRIGAVQKVLGRTHWGQGAWSPVSFQTAGPPPSTVGAALSPATNFSVTLRPGAGWALKPGGAIAVPNMDAADYAPNALNSFVHGTSHPDLKVPFRMNAWFNAGATLTAHVNSVSQGAVLGFYVDNALVLTKSLPDKDGKFDATVNEYNLDVVANVSAGKHVVEIRNTGSDWFYLDWVKLTGVQPSTYANQWEPSPSAVGTARQSEALLYVVSPKAVFPRNATHVSLPTQHNQSITLTAWVPGSYVVQWFRPLDGSWISETAGTTTNQLLRLPLPDYAEDLAGVLQPVPTLNGIQRNSHSGVTMSISNTVDFPVSILRTREGADWERWLEITNRINPLLIPDEVDPGLDQRLYRVQTGPWHNP